MNKHISKKAKAAVAACLGVSLLLGGSTYALWTTNASVASKATVTSGDLKATLLPGQQWQDVSDPANPYTVESLADYRLAPGGSLRLSQSVNVVNIGDNLLATLHVRLPNTTSSQALQAQAKFTVTVYDKTGKQLATVTPTTFSSDGLKLDLPALPHTGAAGDNYRVELTVALPSAADNATKLQVGSLSDLSMALEQTQKATVAPATPVSSFTWSSTGTDITITSYTGTAKDVVIPAIYQGKPVTAIAASAFASKGLTSVVIPDSVTTIGDTAFTGNSLATVKLSSNLKTIGARAFTTNKLTTIDIPKSVTDISIGAFSRNPLTSVTIPSGVKTIGNGAFLNNVLTKVTIPASVTSIGTSAFSNEDTTLDKRAFDIYFEGNAPTASTSTDGSGPFGVAANKKVYYHTGATGFGTTWVKYTTYKY